MEEVEETDNVQSEPNIEEVVEEHEIDAEDNQDRQETDYFAVPNNIGDENYNVSVQDEDVIHEIDKKLVII
jgi:hypothetical protein